MAFQKTKLTQLALRLNAEYIQSGGTLEVARVSGGSGDTDQDDGVTLDDETIQFALADGGVKREGKRLTIPVVYVNTDQTEELTLAEMGVYAETASGPALYATAKCSPAMVIPPAAEGRFELRADIVVELSAEAEVNIHLGTITYLSRAEAEVLFAAKDHAHTAAEISESTGESVEAAQRRQDALLESIVDGMSGMTLIWTFAEEELPEWDWDCGLIDGVWMDGKMISGGRDS